MGDRKLTEAARSDFNRFSTKLESFFAYSSPASLLRQARIFSKVIEEEVKCRRR